MSKLIYIHVLNIFLPHPNPPLGKGRGHDVPVSPLDKGGLRGVKNHNVLLDGYAPNPPISKGRGNDVPVSP
jgi:hypothetical protein